MYWVSKVLCAGIKLNFLNFLFIGASATKKSCLKRVKKVSISLIFGSVLWNYGEEGVQCRPYIFSLLSMFVCSIFIVKQSERNIKKVNYYLVLARVTVAYRGLKRVLYIITSTTVILNILNALLKQRSCF